MITLDELAAFGSTLFVIYAILQMAGRYGGVRSSIREMVNATRTRNMQAWQLILLGLMVPQMMQLLYYALLVLPLPAFETDLLLRQSIVRSYTIFSNLILGIYFLNGKLVAWIDCLYSLWKRRRHSPT